MNLFFVMTGKNGEGERFLRDVSPLVSRDDLEVFHDVASFAQRLRKPRDPFPALLLLGPSHEDLKRVASLKDIIKDARILLVLGDQGEETITLAHKALPTYISYLDNGTSGVVAVLKQLMRDSRAKQAEK